MEIDLHWKSFSLLNFWRLGKSVFIRPYVKLRPGREKSFAPCFTLS